MVNVQNAYADEATIDGVTYTYSDAQYAEVKGIVISRHEEQQLFSARA